MTAFTTPRQLFSRNTIPFVMEKSCYHHSNYHVNAHKLYDIFEESSEDEEEEEEDFDVVSRKNEIMKPGSVQNKRYSASYLLIDHLETIFEVNEEEEK